MLEASMLCFVGWLLLATTSFRYRRDLGITAPATIRIIRSIAVVVLTIALFHCGAPLTGERFVRFLGAASIGGVALVMLLSFKPTQTMHLVRIALTIAQPRNRLRNRP